MNRAFLFLSLTLVVVLLVLAACSGSRTTSEKPAAQQVEEPAPPASQPASEKTEPASEKAYVCVQDGVLSDKPGNCPKCNMALVEVERSDVSFSCPMHPEEVSDKPGKCPKCGMFLTMHVKGVEEPAHPMM